MYVCASWLYTKVWIIDTVNVRRGSCLCTTPLTGSYYQNRPPPLRKESCKLVGHLRQPLKVNYWNEGIYRYMLKGNYLIRRDILFVFIAWYTYIYVGRFLYICQRERFKYVCTAENLTHQLNTFWQLHDFLCLVEPRKSIYLRRMIFNPVNQFYNWT